MAVTAFSFLLPDLIDKPLWVLGVVSDGRYIGHTLLMTCLVAVAFSLRKRWYGLFAICGGMSHLLSDRSGLVPWYFPFKSYDFPAVDYHTVITWRCLAATFLQMAVVAIAAAIVVFLVLGLSSWVKGRRNPKVRGAGQSTQSSDMER
jgi:hypothetical protein